MDKYTVLIHKCPSEEVCVCVVFIVFMADVTLAKQVDLWKYDLWDTDIVQHKVCYENQINLTYI
jgi:hypothetical protein